MTSQPDENAEDEVAKINNLDPRLFENGEEPVPEKQNNIDKSQLTETSEELSATAFSATDLVRLKTREHLADTHWRTLTPFAFSPTQSQVFERFGKHVVEATIPRAVAATKLRGALSARDSSVIGASILGRTDASAQIAQAVPRTSLAEVLGKSAAVSAAFSLNSGLKVSVPATPMACKRVAESAGFSIETRANLLSGIDKRLSSSVRLAGPNRPEIAGLGSALGTSETVRRITQGIFASNVGLARSVAVQKLVENSGIANVIGRGKIAAPWRQSILSEATARSLMGTMSLPDAGSLLLRDIIGTNAATARVVSRHTELNKALMLAPTVSVRPTRQLRTFLSALPVFPDVDDLRFAAHASRGVAGLAAADLLASPGAIELEAGELLEEEAVEPWVNGPQRLRDLLFVRLGALDNAIPEFLQGAWLQVERKGPAAGSMAAHAVVECLDRTLRAVAPDEAVLDADAAGILPKNSTYDKHGKPAPTRTGRIAFALLERRPRETKLIAAQTKALSNTVADVTEGLQSAKHASDGTVGLIRTYLNSVEHVLIQLLYEPGDQ